MLQGAVKRKKSKWRRISRASTVAWSGGTQRGIGESGSSGPRQQEFAGLLAAYVWWWWKGVTGTGSGS